MSTRYLTRFLKTDANATQTLLRLTLALVILPHGLQKLVGWFGGYGFDATMAWFTQTAGVPAPLAVLAILAESVGALALVAGLGGRLMSFGIASVMVGAVLTSHLPYGFFMDWGGVEAGEGFEYHLLALGLAAAVMWKGSGAWSVDRWLVRRLESQERTVTKTQAVTA